MKASPPQQDTGQRVLVGIAAGDKDDGRLGEGPDLGAQLESAGSRQADVQHHQVGRKGLHPGQGRRSVPGCFHPVAAACQQKLELLPDHRVILHNQNFVGHTVTFL